MHLPNTAGRRRQPIEETNGKLPETHAPDQIAADEASDAGQKVQVLKPRRGRNLQRGPRSDQQ